MTIDTVRISALGLGLFLAGLACGSSSQNADSGSGAGDGGRGGTAAGGSSGSGGRTAACALSGAGGAGGAQVARRWMNLGCMRDLVAPCTCGYDPGGGANSCAACYPSSVTVSSSQQGTCAVVDGGAVDTTVITNVTVRRPDGAVCFTLERSCRCGQACEISTDTWKNGAGQVVARGVAGFGSTSIRCEATGETCMGTGGIGGLSDGCTFVVQPSCPSGGC